MSSVPPGWRKKESKSRKGVFYYVSPAGKTQWEKPDASAKRDREQSDASSTSNKRVKTVDDSEVRAYHLLRKHKDSRRPSSWREKDITKTKAEAEDEVRKFREAILAEVGGDEGKLFEVFTKFAKEESDCSSAKRGGDLGNFGRKKMQPPFEMATYALKVGEMSDLVSTKSGIHIILRGPLL